MAKILLFSNPNSTNNYLSYLLNQNSSSRNSMYTINLGKYSVNEFTAEYANICLPHEFNIIDNQKKLSFNLYYMLLFNKVYNEVEPFCMLLDNVDQAFLMNHFYKTQNARILCFVDFFTLLNKKEKVLALNRKCIILTPDSNCLSMMRSLGIENTIHIIPYFHKEDAFDIDRLQFKFIWINQITDIELIYSDLKNSNEKIIICGPYDLNEISYKLLLRPNLSFLTYKSIDLLYNLKNLVNQIYCSYEYFSLCKVLISDNKEKIFIYKSVKDVFTKKSLSPDSSYGSNSKKIVYNRLMNIIHE